MRFAFVRNPHHKWGGDLKAVQALEEGLNLLGHESWITTDAVDALRADTISFLGTGFDHTPNMTFMQLNSREYGSVPFQDDDLLFSIPSHGLFYYVLGIFGKRTEKNHTFSLESLMDRPSLVYYFTQVQTFHALDNYDFLANAKFVIATSSTEERVLLRDAPGCKTRLLRWAPGFVEGALEPRDDSFLKFTGLKSGSYILQVGRITRRKNQLATLLVTKDLDLPVVFIATEGPTPLYEKTFFAVAQERRKGPVILITQNRSISSSGNLKVIQMPGGEILPKTLLLSAFAHAGLHLHPSFYELPGLTYLEAARLGTPTVASAWGSLKDYFTDDAGNYTLDDRVEYALPYDLAALKKLVEKKFGQKYPEIPQHPVFRRTSEDLARDFLKLMQYT
jgi:glycosyltransferase involved in cell wall biosynthesis